MPVSTALRTATRTAAPTDAPSTRAWLAGLAGLALLALASLPAGAQNMIESGEFVVHYNALPTTQLPPEVARAYNITRSPNRALLNISVQRRAGDGTPEAITAEVQAAATNLTGQRRDLAVREVRDQGAIYYLSETRVTHLETLTFNVVVQPAGASAPITLQFQQQFFTE